MLFDVHDLSDDAALGDDLVSFLHRFQHLVVTLPLLRLRPEKQEVEDREDGDHLSEEDGHVVATFARDGEEKIQRGHAELRALR